MADEKKGIITKEDQKRLDFYRDSLRDMTEQQMAREKELAELRENSARAQLEAAADQDEKVKERLKKLDAFLAKEKELAELAAEGLEDTKEYADLQKKIADAAGQFNKDEEKAYIERVRQSRLLVDAEKERAEILEYQKKVLDTLNTIGQEISGINFSNFATFGGFASAAMEMAHALDTANVELAKATGYTRALRPDMDRLVTSNSDIALTMNQAGAAIAALNSSMTTFGAVSAGTRHVIEDFAVELAAMGGSAEDFGKSMDILTRAMGMSAPTAAATAKEFDQLAQSLGLPTGQLIADFAELGPELASFGKRGKNVFKELQKEARSLGILTKDAFDLATQFDTFEEGASLAGQLNAQLGTQINNLELMMTDNLADRIKILRKEFMTMGKSFQEMSRFETLAVAQILGRPVDEVAKLFSNPVAFQRFQKEQKNMRERAQQMTTAMDKFTASVQSLFVALNPLLVGLTDFASFLAKAYIPQIIIVGLVFKAALVPMFKALLLGTSKLIPAMGLLATKLGIVSATAPVAGGGLASFATIAGTSVVKVLALGKAMLYVGLGFGAVAAGIGLAAMGAAQLVKAFKGMGDESVYALLGLTLFTIGMITFAAILTKSAPLLAGASSGLFIFAAALGAVGLAVGVIAAGFGLMVRSVGQVIEMIGQGIMSNAISGIMELTDALETLGYTILGLEDNNAIKSLSMTVDQLVRLEPVAREGQAGAEFFNALSRTVEVTANLTPAQIGNIETVTSQMVRVTGEVNAGNTARLDAIANAVRANGARREEHIPVKLMLKNQVLGDAIIKYVREAAQTP